MKKITLIFAFILASFSQSYGQFTEGFEAGIPATWTVINGGDTNTWVQFTTPVNFVITGTASALITYNATVAHDDYLITPAITVTAGVNDKFSFKARSFDPLFPEQFDLVVSTTTPTAAAFTTTLATIAPDSNLTTATNYTFNLSAYVGQTIYIGMHSTTTNQWRIAVDDVVSEALPATPPSCAANPVSTPNPTCGNFASTISWDAAVGATGYNLTVGTTSGGTDVLNNVFIGNVLTYTFPTQSLNTTYYWKVIPINPLPAVGCTENSYTTNATGCYCTSVPTSNDNLGITNVLLGATNVPNGDVTYADYTSTSVTFSQGLNSNCQITFGTGYTYNTYIWIDFNNNYIFDSTELVFTGVSLATNPTTYNASFVMPATAALGSHRMRIGTSDDPQTPPNPCYSDVYGVTLDFTVNIIAPSCTPPAATAVLTPACATNQFNVAVNVTALGNGNPAITDGTTTWPVSTVGLMNVGPFASGANVTLTLLHGGDSSCNVPLGSFNYNCPPSNDNCSGAISLTVNDTFCNGTNTNGTNIGATDSGVAIAACYNYGLNDVWFSFTAPSNTASVDISTDFLGGTLQDTEVALYSGTCSGTLTELDCDNDSGIVVQPNTFSWNSLIIDSPVTPNTTYYVRVSGYTAANVGTFCLRVASNVLGNDTFANDMFNAYPNPVKDILNLSYTQNITKVQVMNLLGQEVLTKSINATQSQVDMSNLAQGTYLVRVTSEDQVKTIKVIKE
jgi:hypothetical protein